jgi:hypothetical protein
MMIMKHKRQEFMGQCEEDEKHGPFGLQGGLHNGLHSGLHSGLHGEWGKRVPPFFEKWHEAAHAPKAPSPEI